MESSCTYVLEKVLCTCVYDFTIIYGSCTDGVVYDFTIIYGSCTDGVVYDITITYGSCTDGVVYLVFYH
jgi:hypothetical protein